MTRIEHDSPRPRDSQLDEALRDLLGPVAQPTLRTGFNRRLARAVEREERATNGTRQRRRLLLAYWTVAGASSIALVWQFQDRLASGPGLWLFAGGLATLAAASLTLSLLAMIPVGLVRRIRP